MKNKAFLFLLLSLGFVGATSCGDDEKIKQLEVQNQALQLANSMRPAQTVTAVNTVTSTQIKTVTATKTSTSTVYTFSTTEDRE